MAESIEVYLARADAAAAEAKSALLANVRERSLRAEAAWRGMAERMQQTLEQRIETERDRAARRAAEGIS